MHHFCLHVHATHAQLLYVIPVLDVCSHLSSLFTIALLAGSLLDLLFD
jgi:hypothetical protein